MRDEQHRADKIVQQPFQPFDGFEIQMVGRFVEDQHIRLDHQCLRQRHALALPAGHVADAFVGVQIQPRDRGLDARLHRPAVLRLELGLQVLHFFQQRFHVRIRFGQLMGNMMVIAEQRMQIAQALRHRIEYRVVGIQHRFLADVANPGGRRAPHQPVIEVPLPGQHAHHARLAAAVAPDQADAFALIELKVGVVEQCDVPECEARLV